MTDAETVVRAFYAALANGRADVALASLSPEVEWTETKGSPYFAGTVKGVDAVVSTVLQPIGHDFDDFATTPNDFVSADARTVSFGHYTGRSKQAGLQLDVPFVHVWTVEDGRIVRFVQYTDTA